MTFPLTRVLGFQVPTNNADRASREALVEAMANWIAQSGARGLQVGDESFAFKGGLFSFITDWRISTSKRMTIGFNPLIPVSRGMVELRREGDGYRVICNFRFTELLVASIGLILLFLGLQDPEGPALAGLQPQVWLAIGWCGIFLWGYFVSPITISKGLQNALEEALAEE